MGWIPVTEQLPDDERAVLVARANGEVWLGWHAEDHWFDVCSGDQYRRVTHWQHLPEPPQ